MCSNNDQFEIFCQVQQKRMWENEKPNRNKNADSRWDFLIPPGRSHVKKSIRIKKTQEYETSFCFCLLFKIGKYHGFIFIQTLIRFLYHDDIEIRYLK